MGYLASTSWNKETFCGPVSVQVREGEMEMLIWLVWVARWMLWASRCRASWGVRRGMENVEVGVRFVAVLFFN